MYISYYVNYGYLETVGSQCVRIDMVYKFVFYVMSVHRIWGML